MVSRDATDYHGRTGVAGRKRRRGRIIGNIMRTKEREKEAISHVRLFARALRGRIRSSLSHKAARRRFGTRRVRTGDFAFCRLNETRRGQTDERSRGTDSNFGEIARRWGKSGRDDEQSSATLKHRVPLVGTVERKREKKRNCTVNERTRPAAIHRKLTHSFSSSPLSLSLSLSLYRVRRRQCDRSSRSSRLFNNFLILEKNVCADISDFSRERR